METDDLYQVALLVDQMKHDDINLRVNAFKTQALGVERTRDELIPFIAESMEDEDAVIAVLAEKLGALCNFLGGEENVYVLLKPLELLVCGEESSIRDKALASAEEIVKRMSTQHIFQHFIPLVHSLSSRDWFTARGAAASLAPLVFSKLDENKKSDIVAMLSKLSEDDAPAVRRSVAKSLSPILRRSSSGSYKELVELYNRLSKDDQDSIRIQIIPASTVFVELLPWDMKVNHVVPTLVALASDKSWRVRWSLSHHLKDIFPQFQDADVSRAGNTFNTLSTMFDGLLNDPEPEVRAAAAAHLSAISQHLPKSTITSRIIPSVQRLATDNSEFVKAVVSGEISMLSPVLGKEDTIKLLLPMLLTLLRDDASDVRLNVISQLHGINSTIGVELLSQSLLPAIVNLAQDSKWRVRLAVIELMPMIGKQLGVGIFTDNLISICISWLHDNIHAIRKAAAINIKKLTFLFGDEWAEKNVVPQVQSMATHAHYLQRMTSIYACQVLIENFATKNIDMCRKLVSLCCSLKKDNVANVRLTLAKVLAVPLRLLPAQETLLTRNDIIATLKEMLTDSDRDVRYYANETLKKI